MIIEEGITKLKISKPLDKKSFYNPSMHFDRDLMIAFISSLPKKLVVCDALAACGARGIRIAKETKKAKEVWLNDLSKDALRFAKENIKMNGLEGKVMISNEDAIVFLSKNKRKFDYIDIDPFGSSVYYIDAAARGIKREGFIGFAATDKSTLCGIQEEACLRRYGIVCFRTDMEHEVGIRNLIASVALMFSKYMFSFTPLISYHRAHYYRVYGYLKKGRRRASENLKENIGILNYCRRCLNRKFSSKFLAKCDFCGDDFSHIFLTWKGKICDRKTLEDVEKELGRLWWLKNANEIRRLIEVLKQETKIPQPFYNIHAIASTHKLRIPKLNKLVERLKEKGFESSRTHFLPYGIKTEAGMKELLETIREMG